MTYQPTSLSYLLTQIDTARLIYEGLSPEVRNKFPMRWSFSEPQRESPTRLSSFFLMRAAGLPPQGNPSLEQQRDAVLERWDLDPERAIPHGIPNRRTQVSEYQTLSKIMVDLAERTYEVRKRQEELFGNVTNRRNSMSSNRPPNGVETSPELEIPEPPSTTIQEPKPKPRSLGPSASRTGLETFVQGRFVKTNGRGEFSLSIRPIFASVADEIQKLITHDIQTRRQLETERAAELYFELMQDQEKGKSNLRVLSRQELYELVENDFSISTITDAKRIATIVVDSIKDVITEAKEKIDYELTEQEVTNLIIDLAIFASSKVVARLPEISETLPLALEKEFAKNPQLSIPLGAREIARVLSRPHEYTLSDPTTSFKQAVSRT